MGHSDRKGGGGNDENDCAGEGQKEFMRPIPDGTLCEKI
jgi:hypothetical protein